MRDGAECKGRYYAFSVLYSICVEISQLTPCFEQLLCKEKGDTCLGIKFNSIDKYLINISILMPVPCWFYYYGFIVQLKI